MKARVFVSLKKSVLDPQGKTIHHSLRNLGYENVRDVRQGKVFEIDLDIGLDQEEARREGGHDRGSAGTQTIHSSPQRTSNSRTWRSAPWTSANHASRVCSTQWVGSSR